MKTIPLTRGYEAIVDNDDYDRLCHWKWQLKLVGQHKMKYAGTYIPNGTRHGKSIKMEFFIINVPSGFLIDHKNGNGLDNRKENLRIATYQQNAFNRNKTNIPTYSQYKGVTKNWKSPKCWQAQIRDGNKTLFLGSFPCQFCAALAYDMAAIERSREFANTNFIRP